MADSKITALTALTAADPANDMIPIVDVSDTPPASGNTKRISINNILACSPTATLASLNVTGSSMPANGLYLPTTNTLEFSANTLAQYRIAPLGVFSWYDGAGGTRMTLNSTGLGVGVASPLGKLHIRQSGAGIQDVGYFENNQAAAADVGARVSLLGTGSVAMAAVESAWNGAASTDAYLSFRTRGSGAVNERLRIDSVGNVGIGVTPSYLLHTAVASGANRSMARFQVTGASNGLTITWNHATTKMIVNFSNLPTSSAGLASGDLYIDTTAGNTLKVA